MTAPWTETRFPTIVSKYKSKDLFNVDEFGLFFQCLPNKTFNLRFEMCSVGKKIKIRLTEVLYVALKISKIFLAATETKERAG